MIQPVITVRDMEIFCADTIKDSTHEGIRMSRYYEWRGKVVRHKPGFYEIFRDGKWHRCGASRPVEEDGYDITDDEARKMIEKEGGSLDGEDDAPH